MSHNVETMAYAGETPWHGLGKLVKDNLTPAQMMVTAGLDWEVAKYPAFIEIGGEKVETNRSALIRSSDNSILDFVPNTWNPVQNVEAFKFFDEFVKAGNMTINTAGSLQKGKLVWALAKVSESFELFGGDKIDAYLLFSNPHQYMHAITTMFTPVRVVCNNTLTMALSNEANKAIARSSHATVFDPEVAKQTLGIASDQLKRYKDLVKLLGKKQYKKTDVKTYFKQIFPVYNQKKDEPLKESEAAALAFTTLETQPGAKFAEGTWWQAFNSATYLIDHKLGRTQENRLNSAWFGTGRRQKQKALNLALELAAA